MRIIVGISGASGSVYGYRLLAKLRARGDIETHLVMSRAGERTAWLEMGLAAADFRALADEFYSIDNIGAALASGSFRTAGMVVAPCSIHTMSAIATGLTDNLLARAADVCLKERRRLVLMLRETPLHTGHLRTMLALAEMGAVIAPPVPAFYPKPETAMDIVDFSVDRVLDLMGLPGADTPRWDGARATPDAVPAPSPENK